MVDMGVVFQRFHRQCISLKTTWMGWALWHSSLSDCLGHPHLIWECHLGSQLFLFLYPSPLMCPWRWQMIARVFWTPVSHLDNSDGAPGSWLQCGQSWLLQAFRKWTSKCKNSLSPSLPPCTLPLSLTFLVPLLNGWKQTLRKKKRMDIKMICTKINLPFRFFTCNFWSTILQMDLLSFLLICIHRMISFQA